MSKVIKKITKPISKGLDKIVPNELKPLLPYAAAFMPYLLPASGIFSSMAARGLASAGANAVGQLAQEGNEGELNPLSLLLAGGQGAFTAKDAGNFFRGKVNPGEAVGIPGGNMPGQGGVMDKFGNMQRGFKYDTSGLTNLDKAKNFMYKGGAKLADLAGDASETLKNPFEEGVTLEQITAAGGTPFTQASGDVIYGEAVRQKKDFDRTEAQRVVEEEMRQRGLDQSYIDSITASMTAYGYTQAEIDAILELQGYEGNANGGRIGYRMGGGIMNTPEADFISMDEVVENIGGDKIEDSFEMASGYKLNDFEFQQDVFDTFGLKLYNLKDDPEAGTFDEGEVREMLYSDQYASGGIINAYNMGGSVLPQGMEMDYRQGGMIPMGSAERADDVPARVSKNEFVMTADAVRAAGGGSVNKGAQKMYQLMNNLEART